MKKHFVKIAVSLLGKDTALEIIRDICVKNKLSRAKRKSIEEEIFNCKLIKDKTQEVILPFESEIFYEQE